MTEKRKALLIGNSQFPSSNGGFSPLRCSPEDVSGMKEVLTDPERGNFEVKVICEQSNSQVFGEVESLLNESDKEDLILIYYSGHGQIDNRGKLHLATSNTKPSLLKSTSLPIDWVLDCVKGSACQRFVLILDCCYSGAVRQQDFEEFDSNAVDSTLRDFSERIAPGVGKFILTATTAITRAQEREGERFSTFTKHLLQGLQSGDADANEDGFITAGELFDYLKQALHQENGPEPARWTMGAASALVISHAPSPDGREWRKRLSRRLQQEGALLPASISATAKSLTNLSPEELRQRHTGTTGLLMSWAQRQIETAELIDRWERLKPVLPGTDQKSEFRREDRWSTVRQARQPVMDLGLPTYLLDSGYHFLDWNPAFDEVIAKPLGLCRGQHAKDFVDRFENAQEVNARAKVVFKPGDAPLVDVETLRLRTPEFGLVEWRKIAAQIPTGTGRNILWCVTLNLAYAEAAEALWAAIQKRLSAEVNWSKYAVLYDQMLEPFDAYGALVRQVTSMVGDALCCADLAAGTGNGTLELLRATPRRKVWALEANEFMLERLRTKTEAAQLGHRTNIFKGDLLLSLQEFNDYFDAAVMINALYAIEDRQRCLLGVFRALKPGGVLALSTSTVATDLDKLFSAIRSTLAAKPGHHGGTLLDDLAPVVDEALKRHLAMESWIHHDSQQDVLGYVETAGFIVEEMIPSAYCDAVMIVKARKPMKAAQPQPLPPAVRPPTPTPAVPIFISYSQKEPQWLKRIQTVLQPLTDNASVRVWADTDIETGTDWDKTINLALEEARVAILLVSPAFLASKFIKERELPRFVEAAKAGRLKLFWVLISDCLWEETVLGTVQSALPTDVPLDTLADGVCAQSINKLARAVARSLKQTPGQ